MSDADMGKGEVSARRRQFRLSLLSLKERERQSTALCDGINGLNVALKGGVHARHGFIMNLVRSTRYAISSWHRLLIIVLTYGYLPRET